VRQEAGVLVGDEAGGLADAEARRLVLDDPGAEDDTVAVEGREGANSW
jgi:hypothetical protein